ncbi:MAG: acyl carrier protein [Clostridiales bacterium]|jgi:acyl carrier protein|nr:acyl carrier protein [Clostridiales bacterium]
MSIFETVQKTLARQLEISPELITPETRIMEDLGVDSLDLVELIMALEEGYNIIISAENGKDLTTIGEIAEFIESELKKKA